MAKKFVRGITDVKTINNQDYDTNNVNDLLSDGQYNYIHRKKGKAEEYHNLTDNIKTISSDNTELLSVTNNNKTTNTATLHPKHDAQKEQVLESTRNTVNIQHGTNGTAEKTTVDTNPQKVLEHEKLKTGDGLTTSFNTDETTIMFKATKKLPETNLNTLGEGVIYGEGFSIEQVPKDSQDISAAYVTINTSDSAKVQFYIREQGKDDGVIRLYYRFIMDGEVTEWRKMPGDRSDLNYELAQKEQVLESTRDTVNIQHGTNGTDEKTTVDTNPQKVLEHENLISSSQYVTIEHVEDSNTSEIKTDELNNTINELNSKITSVEGKIPTEIGGRNLYVLSKNSPLASNNIGDLKQDLKTGEISFKVTGSDPYFGKQAIKDEAVGTSRGVKIPVKAGQDIAVWLTNPLFIKNVVSYFGDDDRAVKKYKDYQTNKFVIPAGELAGVSYVTFRFGLVQESQEAGSVHSTKVKIEYGNVYTDWSPAPEDIYPLLEQKQDVLTAGDGISITGDSIHLTTLNDYSEDLNILTYTCTAKPIDNTPNLPTGVAGNGVLSVIRVGNVVSQTYHALDNNVYYRITNNSSTTFVWTPWVKLTTTAV